ncbi:hypothetical protein Tco_1134729 [Tanacetum coccineum]
MKILEDIRRSPYNDKDIEDILKCLKDIICSYLLMTRIPIEDVPSAAHEKPSESSPKDNDVQDTEDAADKEFSHFKNKPQLSLIYLNNKEEKRVMDLIEIVKFCDAMLERVLKEVKTKIFENRSFLKEGSTAGCHRSSDNETY